MHQTVAAEELDAAVDRKIGEIRSAGPYAASAAKLLIRRVARLDLRRVARDYDARDRRAAHQPEGQEGLRAFLERRKPTFHDMIRRLLVANRGEIAVRVARGAREAGIVPVGIYSEADANAYHLRFVDDARCVGPAPARSPISTSTHRRRRRRSMGADAVHPGYGFLSERPAFARAVAAAGMIFVGPSPEAMAAMGSKIEAKRRVREFDVPTVPGYDGEDQRPEALRARPSASASRC